MMRPSPALDEIGRDRLAHQEHGLDVDVEGLIPVRLGIPRERQAWRRGDPGIVHDDVDPAQVRLDAVEARLDVGLPGDIAALTDGRPAQCLDLPGDAPSACFLDVGDGDVRALPRQAECDPSADPGAAPGHHRHLSGESHRIPLLHSVLDTTGVGLDPAAALDAAALIPTDTCG